VLRDERYKELLDAVISRGSELTPASVANGEGDELSESATAVFEELMAAPEAIQDVHRTIDDAIAKLRVRVLEGEAADIDRQVGIAQASEKDNLLRRKMAIRDEIKALGGTGARRFGVRGGR
jgi:hypothetical protein